MKVTWTELSRHTSEIIRKVERSGPVTVTYRGKPRAVVTLIGDRKRGRRSIRDYPAFGILKDREDMQDPVAWVRKLRRSRHRRLMATIR